VLLNQILKSLQSDEVALLNLSLVQSAEPAVVMVESYPVAVLSVCFMSRNTAADRFSVGHVLG
jgi:hypothetical protein